jgi:hypothetical protein
MTQTPGTTNQRSVRVAALLGLLFVLAGLFLLHTPGGP